MGPLDGRRALITGAAGGIGTALAARFAQAGARLALLDRVAVEGAPEGSVVVRCDLTDPASIARAVAEAADGLGGLDIVVNNAGVALVAPGESLSLADWDLTLAVNLRAPFLVAQAAFPHLKASGRGRLIGIASQAALIGLPDHAAYAASKAGLVGLTLVLAVEWARHGITCNCISPTVVETPMALVVWTGAVGDRARAEIPTGRFARPDEIAAAALFLAGDDAAMINGANLRVDGGNTIR